MKTATPKFEPKFILRATGIEMNMVCSDTRLYFSIGHKIAAIDWNTDNQKAYGNRKHVDPAINKRILELQSLVDEYVDGKEIVLRDEIRDFLKVRSGRTEQQIRKTGFFEVSAANIDKMQAGEITVEGKRYSNESIENLRYSLSVLKRFNSDLSFYHTSPTVRESFMKWAIENNLTLNSADSVIKDWKRFFSLAELELDFARVDFEDLKTKKIFLDQREIRLLGSITLEELQERGKELNEANKAKGINEKPIVITRADERIRDRYLINLSTGLRVSDMKMLSTWHVSNGKITFQLTQKMKKMEAISIPIDATIQAIMEKYQGEFPKQYHPDIVNRRIKIIARLAGITGWEEMLKDHLPKRIKDDFAQFVKDGKILTLPGNKDTVKVQRCELISNHSARRSYITNALRAGVSPGRLRRTTGQTLTTLEMYDKLSAEENADDLKGDPYFQRPSALAV